MCVCERERVRKREREREDERQKERVSDSRLAVHTKTGSRLSLADSCHLEQTGSTDQGLVPTSPTRTQTHTNTHMHKYSLNI